MAMNLCIAGRKDQAIVLELVRQHHAFEDIEFDAAATAQSLAPLLLQGSDDGRIWLINNDDKTVGYVAVCFGYSIEFQGRDGFVDEMYIVPEHRGKGFGAKVLADVGAAARLLGVKALHLEVARDNERAQRLYQRAGFTPREKYFLMSTFL